MIKGVFFAITEVFADFCKKSNKFYHIFKWSFWGVNNTTTSKSYLDLSAANSPSIQNQNAISLKRKVFSGSSTNWLTPKVKDDHKVAGARSNSRHQLGEFSLGRSMIEMLGVLAIVGVLSVGGIAGYSKAMEQWKITRLIQEYNTFVTNLLEYRPYFVRDFPNGHTPVHKRTFYNLGLLPDKWRQDAQPAYLRDSYGNYVSVLWDCYNIKTCAYVLEVRIGFSDKENRTKNLCREMLRNFVKPLHNVVNYGRGTFGLTPVYYGDAFCGAKNRPCLKNLSLNEIDSMCSNCKGGFNNNCSFSIQF